MITETLGWLADKVVTGMAVHRLRQDPVVRMGREAIWRNWTAAPETTQCGFSKDFIAKITKQMGEIVIGIATAQDSRMANRERLVHTAMELAIFKVLVLPPPPHPDVSGLRGKPGITGELKQRIPEIVRKDKFLRDSFVPAGGVENRSPDELLEAASLRCFVLNSWCNMHQLLRMAWDDAVPEPLADWYRPLVENLCAWQEYQFRKLLGMEPSLGKIGRDADIEALARSTFAQFVLDGEADPVSEFREHYKDWHL